MRWVDPKDLEKFNDKDYIDRVRKRSEKNSGPTKEQSIKLILRGLVFLVLLILFDIGYRRYRFEGGLLSTGFMIITLASAIGAVQIPIGIYYYIKRYAEKDDSESHSGAK